MTHYIAKFTQSRAGLQRAICNAWVTPDEHATEPTCHLCAARLCAPVITSVVVKRYPFGSSTFSNCTADVFNHDELTVTCPAMDGRTMQVFGPGSWREARVYGSNEYPLFTFVGRLGMEQWERDLATVKAMAAQRTA